MHQPTTRSRRARLAVCSVAPLLLLLLSVSPPLIGVAARPSQPGGGRLEPPAAAAAAAGAGRTESKRYKAPRANRATQSVTAMHEFIGTGMDNVAEIFREIRGTFTYFSSLGRNFTHGGEWREWYKTAAGEL